MKLCGHFLIASMFCLLGFAPASRGADHIKDNLDLFSQPALAAANKQINEVWQQQRRMIAIETRLAPELPAKIDPANKTAANEFYTRWSHEEFERNNIHGAYLVILQNPSKFRLWVSEDLLKQKVVSQADINTWETVLVRHLRNDEYDAALRDIVASIAAKFSAAPAKAAAAKDPDQRAGAPVAVPANKQPPRPPQQVPAANNEGPSVLTWVLIAGGVFLVFRIIRSIFAAMSNRNQYGPGGTPNQYGNGPNMNEPGYGAGGMGGRGGGFMTGMLGGLFGGMAGNWMYDRMSGGNQAHGAEPPAASGGGFLHEGSSGDSGSDNSSGDGFGGGDWSSDAGGGDFGGDGGGGGDW